MLEEIRIAAEAAPPDPALVEVVRDLPPGRALDLACGTGRHSIWLAQCGWQVTAVDRSSTAVSELRRRAPSVDARVVDLETEGFPIDPESYDLIVVWLYLQRNLFPLIRAGVRAGGVVAASALTAGRFAAKPGELEGAFAGWESLHAAETARAYQFIARKVAHVPS